ncbi:MAG: hypothetical protein V9G10_07530 [Candidatus Nanopelagicales bacterium]
MRFAASWWKAATVRVTFATSDIAQFADLFIPEAHRDAVFAFVRGNVCSKAEIGLKATGNGMIAITNWHLLTEGEVAGRRGRSRSARAHRWSRSR